MWILNNRRRSQGSVIGLTGVDLYVSAHGNLSVSQEAAIRTFWSELDAAGIIEKTIAFYPLIGTTLNEIKWNLIDARNSNDAFRLVSGSPNIGTNVINPTSNYNTFIDYSNYPNDTFTMCFDVNGTTSANNNAMFQIWVSTTSVFRVMTYSSNIYFQMYSITGAGNEYLSGQTDKDALWMFDTDGVSSQKIYKNGLIARSTTDGFSGTKPPNQLFLIRATYTGYRNVGFFTEPLTASQNLSLYTAINNLNTSIGR